MRLVQSPAFDQLQRLSVALQKQQHQAAHRHDTVITQALKSVSGMFVRPDMGTVASSTEISKCLDVFTTCLQSGPEKDELVILFEMLCTCFQAASKQSSVWLIEHVEKFDKMPQFIALKKDLIRSSSIC